MDRIIGVTEMNRNLVLLAIGAVAVIAVAAVVFANTGDRTAPAPDDPIHTDASVALVYFSETGNTEDIAKKIAEAADCDLIRIVPEVEYTSADLNYNDSSSRTYVESHDPSARPGIANSMDLSRYDCIFLGYPIWYGDSPKIMWTFAETQDLAGKTVIPFCTSGSSGIGSSAAHLEALTDEGAWLDGKRFSGSASYDEVYSWVSALLAGDAA